VSVAGGGGGAGLVYIGAYERLEREGIVPAYVIGSSIGALVGIFRSAARPRRRGTSTSRSPRGSTGASSSPRRDPAPPRAARPAVARARAVDRPQLPALRRRPAQDQRPRDSLRGGPSPGVRRASFERLPQRFRRQPERSLRERATPDLARSTLRLAPAVARRMWQVAMFFDPRVVKPVALGGDELTAELGAVDAAGFSAAIPGVLHYEIDESDARSTRCSRAAGA